MSQITSASAGPIQASPKSVRTFLSQDDHAARLVQELAERWQRGERPQAETLLADHPEILNHPAAAVQVVCEEICQRQEHGLPVDSQQFFRRFPQWQGQLRMLLDCHRLLAEGTPPAFPEEGERLGEFELLAILGQGAVGRVYLATQPSLADRPVVLKVGPRSSQEHLTLARLQHTHIVPLWQAFDDADRKLQVLCMPYFGGASLDHVLESLRGKAPMLRTGRDLLGAFDRKKEHILHVSGDGPTRSFLERASYVEAVCWTVACLAEGLQHAHARNLVHLDIKPANVLLAADGQPMLLDFHLALAPLRAGQAMPDTFGGTPGYLSPEQAAAMDAFRQGKPVMQGVDGRSDIFSLGMLLYECLAGEWPAQPLKRLDRQNPQVSRGLADVVARCLKPNPKDRYGQAEELAEDLRRHLTHRPLRGVPNRSVYERWRKWRRRRPHALGVAALIGLALLSLAGAGWIWWDRHEGRVREAEQAWVDGRAQLERGDFAEAGRTLSRGQEIARRLPNQAELSNRLGREADRARQAQLRKDLHALADRIRFRFDSEGVSTVESQKLADACMTLWRSRDRLGSLDEQARNDLIDLAVLEADLRIKVAAPQERDASRRDALRRLEDVEADLGTSPLVAWERLRLADELSLPAVRAAARRQVAEMPPRSAWENYAVGRSMLRAGQLPEALRALNHAVALQPDGFWPNFLQGCCAYRLEHHLEAVQSFRVCIALMPDRAECRFNRALALQALGQADLARQDYDRALELDASLADAWLNRGILQYRKKRYEEATADLRRSLDAGADPAMAHYNLALICYDCRQFTEAKLHIHQALAVRPLFPEAQVLQLQLEAPTRR